MYRKEKNVIQQKCLNINKYDSIIEALSDNNFTMEDSEVYFILSKRGQLYELNLIASLVWELLISGKTQNEILDIFVEIFDVAELQASKDIEHLIKDFLINKLIAEC